MDRETRAHLEAVRDQIARILDPRFNPAPTGPGPVFQIGIEESDLLATSPDGVRVCWPDYVIRP
jgi:hypothetical protein